MTAQTLERRLAAFRTARRAAGGSPAEGGDRGPVARSPEPAGIRSASTARRLAAAVGGEPHAGPEGCIVRREPEAIDVPIDRRRLAGLPGYPGPDVPLVCLDTETTGLGSATGTVAWLVGLGWWEAARFSQLQLLLPDHADEAALLAALEAAIPADAWLVTYNGCGFDWPLLVTRYRLLRRAAPAHGGMLDLLPHVRRLFKHRLGDARLATVERELLGVRRLDDVAGWEIPGRYLDFLRGGSAGPLRQVAIHNEEDVRSLARLVAHLDARYADPDRRRAAPPGDLVGLARAFTRQRRHGEALGCLDAATASLAVASQAARGGAASLAGTTRPARGGTPAADPAGVAMPAAADHPAFAAGPRFAPGFHRAGRDGEDGQPRRSIALPTVSLDRIAVERARTLRRLGRADEALAAWEALARGGGPLAPTAWIEAAKLHERVGGRLDAALTATEAADRLLRRLRHLGRADARLERAVARRRRRLRVRLDRASRASPTKARPPPRA